MTTKNSSLASMKKRYLALRQEYYENGNTSATDAEYDALEDAIREADPEWSGLHSTGVRVGKKTAKALRVPMPSLDKIKADNPSALNSWLRKVTARTGTIHASEKVDGSSIQATWVQGKLTELITRGDGVTGKDISYFIPHVNLPRTIKTTHQVLTVRFEAAMKRNLYLKHYAGQFDSDRALASAVFNRQDVHPAMRHIDFLALKVQHPVMSIQQSQALVAQLGLNAARGKLLPAEKCTADSLSRLLEKVRESSAYILDGLVLHSTSESTSVIAPTEDRPDYARAFKVNDEANAIETTIVDIIWKASSFGVLVPKAVIKPIQFGGVTVKHAALHNPRWATDRGAGIGAKVKVIRSGDIIPKIIAVAKPATLELPSLKQFGSYSWDKTRTALVLDNPHDSSNVQVETIARFFGKLGLDNISKGLAEKLVAAGYSTTASLPTMTEDEFSQLPGVKTSAANMAVQMRRVRDGEFSLIKLMAASGCFDRGLGETRLQTLWEAMPTAFHPNVHSRKDLEASVAAIPGCGPVFAKKFVSKLAEFWSWVQESGTSYAKPVKAAAAKNGPLTGTTFCWTGYRDKAEEAYITDLGGRVESFKATTSVLFYRLDGKRSTKIEKAGERAKTFSEFKKGLKHG